MSQLPPPSGHERLTGHIAWAFDGRSQFEALARSFLDVGRAKGEKLIFIADGPDPGRWPSEPLESGALQLASVRDVYGSEIQADQQRQVFAGTLDEALRQGYSGIRVAADNTSLVTDSDRARAWTAWEVVADAFMADLLASFAYLGCDVSKT